MTLSRPATCRVDANQRQHHTASNSRDPSNFVTRALPVFFGIFAVLFGSTKSGVIDCDGQSCRFEARRIIGLYFNSDKRNAAASNAIWCIRIKHRECRSRRNANLDSLAFFYNPISAQADTHASGNAYTCASMTYSCIVQVKTHIWGG